MAKITKERKITYYIGMVMMVIGFMLFISVFFLVIGFMGADPFAAGNMAFGNAPIGMLLMIAGSFVMRIGARGTAGSGLVLDPEKAREDSKPFSEAAGGIISDVIGNADALDDLSRASKEKEIIKIRCRSCGALNDEDAKFCKACGQEL